MGQMTAKSLTWPQIDKFESLEDARKVIVAMAEVIEEMHRRVYDDLYDLDSVQLPKIRAQTTYDADIPILNGFDFTYNGETNVINWSAGTISYKGTTYEIAAGNSDANDTWLYWDEDDSDSLKHAAAAPGIDLSLWILGYVDDSDNFHKVVQHYLLHAGLLQANTITAKQISAGTITGTEIYAGADITVGSNAVNGSIVITNTPNGHGDSYIACGKTDFTTTQNGFILGVDDSDGDKVKCYLGNDEHYLYWNGTSLVISGQVYIQNPGDIDTSEINNDAGWTDDTAADAAQATADAKSAYLRGDGAPAGGTGDVGDAYYDYTNDKFYHKTGATTWTEMTMTVDSLAAGTIATGGNIFVGQDLVLNTDGAIYTTGKEGYADDTNGIFLGYDTDGYKLYIGNAANHIKWSGTALDVTCTDLTDGVIDDDAVTTPKILAGAVSNYKYNQSMTPVSITNADTYYMGTSVTFTATQSGSNVLLLANLEVVGSGGTNWSDITVHFFRGESGVGPTKTVSCRRDRKTSITLFYRSNGVMEEATFHIAAKADYGSTFEIFGSEIFLLELKR